MTRMEWNAVGDRLYEAGVDRGVLYVDGSNGVPWNGLVAVNETPSSDGPRPYYVDGVKYLNLPSKEEFEASISAFYSPPEFDVCDGTVQIHNGLKITHQRRKSFGLSYRVMVGNDVNGSEHAYKIHLVYNALASPTSRNNSSMDSSVTPLVLEWSVSTMPPPITGYIRSAHLVIDSRDTDPAVLSEIEDLLYGSASFAPTLPTPDEIVAIFQP